MTNRIAGMQIVLISALALMAAKAAARPLPEATATGKTAAAPAPTPPQKRGDRPAPGASSSVLAPPQAASSAAIMNTPQHAPDQLDFGQVLDGKSATRTLALTTNAPGYVTVTIPAGPFRVAEFREMVTTQSPNKNVGGPLPVTGVVRSRIKYHEGQNGPLQWSMAANTDVQIDVVFAPKAQEGGGAFKTAIMNLTGPGPRGNWALSIPLRGVLNELKLGPPERVPPRSGARQVFVEPSSLVAKETGSAPVKGDSK